MLTVGDIQPILENVKVVKQLGPRGGANLRGYLSALTDQQLTDLFYAVDQICIGSRALELAVVELRPSSTT